MTKYYDLGYIKASITKEREDRFLVTIKEGNTEYKYVFKSEVKAYLEILSYTEINEDDF